VRAHLGSLVKLKPQSGHATGARLSRAGNASGGLLNPHRWPEFLLDMERPGEGRERNRSDWAFLREAASFHLAQLPCQEFR